MKLIKKDEIMPGPVSDTYFGSTDLSERWLADMRSKGLKYFVLKATEFLGCQEEEDAETFNRMLKRNEEECTIQGKPACNQYWVVNRDESWAHEVEAILRKNIPGFDKF